MGKTFVLLTLTILMGISQGLDAPIYPNVAYESNTPFEYSFTASADDVLDVFASCRQPAIDIAIRLGDQSNSAIALKNFVHPQSPDEPDSERLTYVLSSEG